MGSGLGRFAYRLGWRRAVVETQLSEAFPGRGAEWIGRTSRACFEHIGCEAVATAALPRLGIAAVRDRVDWREGLEEMRSAHQEGRGVVVVTGHYGNWEIAGSTLAAYGFPVDAVMQGMRNRWLTRHVRRTRRRLGMRLIDRREAWSRLRESLRAGRVVAFVADQDARTQGVFVPFFGRLASTHRAPALLALRAGSPFFVGGVRRVGPRRYEGWARRLEPPETGPLADRVRALTRDWTAELERRIRLSPEQYFWHHRRWKTPAPGTEVATGR